MAATSAFLANKNALIGTALAPLGGGNRTYPSGHLHWPTGVIAGFPTGNLDNYNKHKELGFNGRAPQIVRLYRQGSNISETTGVAGSAGAYGFITSDYRAIANQGTVLSITFKYGSVTSAGWKEIADALNATNPTAAQLVIQNDFKQLATNLRLWHADTGNTAPIKKIMLGFIHEPENNDTSVPIGTRQANYIAATRAIITFLAKRGVGDLAYVSNSATAKVNVPLASDVTSFIDCIEWHQCLMGWQTSDYGFWAGDEYVRILLADPYNWGGGQSSPNGTGANAGRVPQIGDTSGANYNKAWNDLKAALQVLLNWSDTHPDVVLGLGEFATSQYIDRWTVTSNGAAITSPKVWDARPTAMAEWLRQIPRLAAGLASAEGVSGVNAFTAEPRARRIRFWCYWNDQAAMPRWYNQIPFNVGDVATPTYVDPAYNLNAFRDMVNDPWWNTTTPVVNPTITSFAAVADASGMTYTFTIEATAGSSAITGFEMDPGDGSAILTSTGPSPVTFTHTYAAEGTKIAVATVTASGDNGQASNSTTFTVIARESSGSSISPLAGAPLIVPGSEVDDLRFVFNPAVMTLESYTDDRVTRRLSRVVTATAYTFAAIDRGFLVEGSAGTAQTFTIPANSAVPFPIGTILEVTQIGAGQITVNGATGVTVQPPLDRVNSVRSRYGTIRLRQRAVDFWVSSGELTAGTSTATDTTAIAATTDDAFIIDLNGTAGAKISLADWDNQVGVEATYSADSIEGSASAYFNVAAARSQYRKNFVTALGLLWFSNYIKLEAMPADTVYLTEWFNGANKVGDLRVGPTGILTIRDLNTALTGATSSVALAAGAWARFSVRIQPGSTTGHELRVYTGANLHTMTTSFAGSGAATAGGQTAISLIRFGVQATNTIKYRLDRLRGNTTVEPSPLPA